MDHYTLLNPLIGGILIGLASLLRDRAERKDSRYLRCVRSSPRAGDARPPSQGYGVAGKTWRVCFSSGLIGGAALSFALWQSAALFRPMRPLVVMAMAGLLVGFGTRLGGGCTSGHGVCGVGMGAKDSIAATLIFMAAAMADGFHL